MKSIKLFNETFKVVLATNEKMKELEEINKEKTLSGKLVINFSDLKELINAKVELHNIYTGSPNSGSPNSDLQHKVQVARELCYLYDKQSTEDLEYINQHIKNLIEGEDNE